MIGVIFSIIAFYFLYRFIFGFVIPVITTTRNVRSKMKDMNQKMSDYETGRQSSQATTESSYRKSSSPAPSKGDYIDFEEIK